MSTSMPTDDGARIAGAERHGGGALLVIVDVQNDFCEGGALAVTGGQDVAARIHRFVRARGAEYAAIAVSQDWHRGDTDNGGHFAVPPAEPDYRDTWPVHCVAGTSGAALHPEMDALLGELADRAASGGEGPEVLRVHKGHGMPAYSALEGDVVGAGSATSPPESRGSFAAIVADGGWDRVDVVGLALDHCVAATARDAAAAGVSVSVLRDLTAPVDPTGADDVCARLQQRGITVTTSAGEPDSTTGGPEHG